MSLIISKECYEEYGSDLDGCSRQENGGCTGCGCAKEILTNREAHEEVADEVKPPLGVCPKVIHDHLRMCDLARAIYEYIHRDLEPRKEWLEELLEMLKEGE